MDNQEKLLKAIRQQLSKTSSVIDEVATILNISYDAAHRRVSLKSKFSIEETITLCKHFALSMDMLFTDNTKVIVEKTSDISTLADMGTYFKESVAKLEHFKDNPKAKMYYSAKDIPLFHTIGGTLLSKFKLYVWLNLLAGTEQEDTFENFTIDHSLLEDSMKLKSIYENIEVHEVWNDTTINSILQQIYYYFQAGLLSFTNVQLLRDDLKDILNKIEKKCSSPNSRYHLYYNELLMLNNNVLLTSPEKKSLFVPYTMLGYFITNDIATCNNAQDFFRHQEKNSKPLNQSGTRDRKLFFNKAHQKIDFYMQRITNELDYTF
ncbi:MAG: hypothetical protein BM557_03450 [Flavobacterium sp. MedPE-SWcel]|uniref:hypothetical protein n=1 Tax=uncultured Flavobacterium sp. TaxID=165435 RepID=UPI00091800C6|nr:hypothetical protein [uncultured Flavobacterium sp.]OIQ21320.1 MAG: hypothetical protein BM557_03450 [Flavobacterium sp. MedPE-SWcel]